jgi:hypothetical protein
MAFGCQGKYHPIDRKIANNGSVFRLYFRFLDKRLVSSDFGLRSGASEALQV